MNYKAVIFDLDGVICHTDRYHYAAWKQVSDRLGLHFDESIGDQLRGIGRQESFEIILKSNHIVLSDEDKIRYIDQKNVIYRSLLANMTSDELDGDIRKTLEAIRAMGIKIAIGSSSKNAKFILKHIGLALFFDAVSDGNDIRKAKPNPEVFLKAVRRLNLQPQDCLVVEDAQSGIAAARAGGMDSAAIGDAVKSSLATYRLNHLSDIMKYL